MKKIIIFALVLLLIGSILGVCALAINGFDFITLGEGAYDTKTVEISEDFSKISVDLDITDLTVLPSENESCRVEFRESKQRTHEAFVKDGTLYVRQQKEIRITLFNFGKGPEATLYLPKAEYDALTVDNDTGDISVDKAFTFETIDIETDTGDIELYANATDSISLSTDTGTVIMDSVHSAALSVSTETGDIRIKNCDVQGTAKIEADTGDLELRALRASTLMIETDTGDIELEDCIMADSIQIESDTGDIELHRVDAASIRMETDTGDIEGSLLSGKMFTVRSNTGDVRVPSDEVGGRCEINSDTGDIEITIAK